MRYRGHAGRCSALRDSVCVLACVRFSHALDGQSTTVKPVMTDPHSPSVPDPPTPSLLWNPSKHAHTPREVSHSPLLLHGTSSFVPGALSDTVIVYAPVMDGVATSIGRLPLF